MSKFFFNKMKKKQPTNKQTKNVLEGILQLYIDKDSSIVFSNKLLTGVKKKKKVNFFYTVELLIFLEVNLLSISTAGFFNFQAVVGKM